MGLIRSSKTIVSQPNLNVNHGTSYDAHGSLITVARNISPQWKGVEKK